ncbi:MAG TPA: hypothetical protein VHZ55_26970 [Bryobacteraceae bacterium]|jgi:hypothetical protein|nr:hypothetical protein [Bryobacteraceae bacterium]
MDGSEKLVAHRAVLLDLMALIVAATAGNWMWWLTEFHKGGVLTGRPAGFIKEVSSSSRA